MWARGMTICGCVCLLLAGGLAAQERGGFGRGGFGPGMRFNMGSPNVGLLRNPEVRKELTLRDDQTKALDSLLDETEEQMRNSFAMPNFQELQDLSPEERQKRMDENRRKSEEAAKVVDGKLAKILDAKQSDRLKQLRWQREGARALLQSDVAKQIPLSAAQQLKVKELFEGEEAGGGFPPDPEARRKAEADALALLDQAQQTKWKDLKGKEFAFPEGMSGPGGGRRGFGGPGGPMGQERKLVKQFDKDGDGRLNASERTAARELIKKDGAGRRFGPGGGRGGPGGGRGGFRGRQDEPGKPGPKVKPEDVPSAGDAPLYDAHVLRTLFLEFENPEWEAELADFNNTDVEVPATLMVDGQKYPDVGVHFRGMSSFFAVSAGSKRSLNLSLDFVNSKQRLYSYKTLNLLNAHEDPTFLHTVLYSHIARNYIPAPKANFVKVVVNGESWGVYVNAQQFNKEFIAENYKVDKGTRWKVRGSPGGDGGLNYVGDKIEDYKRRYEIKSADKEKAWEALIDLCRTLSKTPLDKLEQELESKLDIDGALWFLALENVLINSDGYWIRASDYCIYLDSEKKFHVIPHDMNEVFQPGMGPGMGRFSGPGGGGPRGGGPGRGGQNAEGPRGNRPNGNGQGPARGPGGSGGAGMNRGGLDLDPLVGITDANKPLRSRLLAVPALRKKYLEHVRTIANDWLDWERLGPVVKEYRTLIDKDVAADTRKLSSYSDFQSTTGDVAASPKPPTGEKEPPRGRPTLSLRSFAEQRRQALLNHPEIRKLDEAKSQKP